MENKKEFEETKKKLTSEILKMAENIEKANMPLELSKKIHERVEDVFRGQETGKIVLALMAEIYSILHGSLKDRSNVQAIRKAMITNANFTCSWFESLWKLNDVFGEDIIDQNSNNGKD